MGAYYIHNISKIIGCKLMYTNNKKLPKTFLKVKWKKSYVSWEKIKNFSDTDILRFEDSFWQISNNKKFNDLKKFINKNYGILPYIIDNNLRNYLHYSIFIQNLFVVYFICINTSTLLQNDYQNRDSNDIAIIYTNLYIAKMYELFVCFYVINYTHLFKKSNLLNLINKKNSFNHLKLFSYNIKFKYNKKLIDTIFEKNLIANISTNQDSKFKKLIKGTNLKGYIWIDIKILSYYATQNNFKNLKTGNRFENISKKVKNCSKKFLLKDKQSSKNYWYEMNISNHNVELSLNKINLLIENIQL